MRWTSPAKATSFRSPSILSPALVISNDSFNRRVGLAIVCPLTNTDRQVPFHLPVPPETGLTGFVMIEQVKSLDYRQRGAKRLTQVSPAFMEEVLDILRVCLESPAKAP